MPELSLNFQPAVPVFDANVRMGHPRDGISESPDASSLLREMDARGITHALVLHEYGDTMSPREGNQLLLREIASQPRLIPQICVLPTDDSLAMLRELDARGQLRSARLSYDTRQKLLLTPDFYGPICQFLESRRIPLFIGAESIDLRDLPPLARAFPELPLVLTEAQYVIYLWLKPLLRSTPTLHLELSRYESFDQVNELVGEFGADRFIYGSMYPRFAMGPILFYLHRCGFSETALAAICAGNLERLLQGGRA